MTLSNLEYYSCTSLNWATAEAYRNVKLGEEILSTRENRSAVVSEIQVLGNENLENEIEIHIKQR